MMKKLLIAACLCCSASAFGAAYQLNLQGLRQLAMGGSGAAWPWDASTIFYNPAGLSRLGSVQANVSSLFIMPSVEYAQTPTGTYTARSQSSTFYPFNIYVGGPIQKNSPWALGIGIYTPFGSGLTWDNNWAGRYLVQSIYLQSVFIQPTISYKINDIVSVGGGFIYAFGNLDLKQALPVQNEQGADGQADLSGRASGIGYNLGIQFKADERFRFGFTYRSRVDMKVINGDATFTVPLSIANNFPNTSFSTRLPLPQVVTIGVGYKPAKKLTVQLDINFTGWAAFDSLKFDFGQTTASLQNNHQPRLYRNTLSVRAGANYDFSRKFALMAGAAYDPTPVRDHFVSPDLPDADRFILTAGLAFRPVKRLCIMAAVEYTMSKTIDATYDFENFNGRYQTTAVTPGIGLSYNF